MPLYQTHRLPLHDLRALPHQASPGQQERLLGPHLLAPRANLPQDDRPPPRQRRQQQEAGSDGGAQEEGEEGPKRKKPRATTTYTRLPEPYLTCAGYLGDARAWLLHHGAPPIFVDHPACLRAALSFLVFCPAPQCAAAPFHLHAFCPCCGLRRAAFCRDGGGEEK